MACVSFGKRDGHNNYTQGGSSMKVYRTDEIRNVVLLGHGGSGKTSLVEAMLYVSGATSRMGKISESNTVSDFDKEEQKRGFSISTSLIGRGSHCRLGKSGRTGRYGKGMGAV